MKVAVKKGGFEPVVITLESQEEVDTLYWKFRWCGLPGLEFIRGEEEWESPGVEMYRTMDAAGVFSKVAHIS